VEAPDLKAALNILGRWCDNQSGETRIDFSHAAIEEALFLTHRFLVDPASPLNLPEVEEYFQSSIFGQEEAVRAVVKMVGLIKAGLSDMRRPFGAFFFVGPTGVGRIWRWHWH
jgi:hypothetical protein